MARASIDVNDLDRAAESHNRAKAVFRQLTKDYPNSLEYPYRLILVLIEIAQTHTRFKQLKQADDVYEEARDVSVRLVEMFPDESKYLAQLAGILHDLSAGQADQGRFGDAREMILQAIKHTTRLLEKDPSDVNQRHQLSNHYAFLAYFNRELGRIDEAIDAADKRLKLWSKEPIELYGVAADYALTGAAAKTDMKLQLRCADLAIETLHRAIKAGYHDVEHAQTNPQLDFIRSRPEFQKLLTEMSKIPRQLKKE